MTTLILPSSNTLLVETMLCENQISDLINAIDKDSDCRWSKYAKTLNKLTSKVDKLAHRQIKELTSAVDHMQSELLKEAQIKLQDKSRSNLIQRISQFSETTLKKDISAISSERVKLQEDCMRYEIEINELIE